ncbi:MAG: ATP-binding protein, partial [Candidatus Nanohaloarchaea archaeon]|nr:ATP-binding protein [Candidatus Nanohaloarchaea archaeon]
VQQYSTNTDLNEEARNLAFSSTNMDANEIQQVVPTNLTNSQLGVLYTALKELKERDDYTLDDVIDTCQQQESKAKWNLINMLEAVRDSGLFADNPTPLEDLITQGEATIINLRGVDPEQQEMAVYQLAKELFERRKRGELEPFFLIIEEAHNFIPEKGMGKAVCSDILRKIASEGRKFGLGLGVISQRPANVAKNILSQCNTQLIMRVTNPNDLNAISRSFEGVTKAVEESITSLPPGVGMVLGKEYPIMTDIRVRKSRHGGETKEVSREEGLEKREDAKKLDQQAEEAEIRVETEREDEEAEEAEDTAQQEEKEETQKITVFDPAMSFEEVQEKLDEPKKAYYPIWIIETGVGRIAVDATDGTVKDRELNLKEEADQVLQLLKQHRLAKQQIIDQVDMDEDTVTAILDRLQEHELIHRVDGEYTYRSPDVFSREQHEIEVDADTTVIEPDVDEETAIQTAEAELHTGADSTRLIYYPYYTAGNRVFDAVMGKEV